MVAVAFDFAGGRVDVAGTFLIGFLLLTMACVVVPLFFNQSADPSLYVDEHWGNGAIDDDEWAWTSPRRGGPRRCDFGRSP
jgi:hypothetical protein